MSTESLAVEVESKYDGDNLTATHALRIDTETEQDETLWTAVDEAVSNFRDETFGYRPRSVCRVLRETSIGLYDQALELVDAMTALLYGIANDLKASRSFIGLSGVQSISSAAPKTLDVELLDGLTGYEMLFDMRIAARFLHAGLMSPGEILRRFWKSQSLAFSLNYNADQCTLKVL